MSEMLTPDLEKEILDIQSQIRRTEFNIRRIADERRVRQASHLVRMPVLPDVEDVRMGEREFALWSLFIGFILGVGAALIASNW